MSIRPLNPELAELARTKLKEDPEKLQNALTDIKTWISEQPHLNANTDDQWLAAYIRGCEYNLNKVKKKLDLFYTCRGTAPEFFELHHRDPTFREIFSTGFYLPLPKVQGQAGRRVTLLRPGVLGSSQNKIKEAFSVVQTIEKIMLMDDDNAVVSGNITIVDMRDNDMSQMLLISTAQYKKLLACQQESVPFADCSVIFINLSTILEFVVNIVKDMLTDSNKKDCHAFGEDLSEMYNTLVPREVMPEEYGGTGGPIQEIIDLWTEKLEQYHEWLEADQRYGVDESKRPGKPKTEEDMFGMQPFTSVFDLCQD